MTKLSFEVNKMNNEEFETKYLAFLAHAQNRLGMEIQPLVDNPPPNPGIALTDLQLYASFVAHAVALGYQLGHIHQLLVRAPRTLASGDRPTEEPDSTTN